MAEISVKDKRQISKLCDLLLSFFREEGIRPLEGVEMLQGIRIYIAKEYGQVSLEEAAEVLAICDREKWERDYGSKTEG